MDQWVNIYSPVLGHIISLLSLFVAFLTLKKAKTIQEDVNNIIYNKNFKNFYRDKKGELGNIIEKFQTQKKISEQELIDCDLFFSKFQGYRVWDSDEKMKINDAIAYLDELLPKYTKLSEEEQYTERINVLLKLKDVYNVIIFKGDN